MNIRFGMKTVFVCLSLAVFLAVSALIVAGNAPKYIPATTTGTTVGRRSKTYRALHVQVIHRHGDRTPITPLKDEKYWESTLVGPELQEKIAQGTKLIQTDINTHKASGRGPFGKLTKVGLFQMIKVGSTLREELYSDKNEDDALSDDTVSSSSTATAATPPSENEKEKNMYQSAIFSPSRPLIPKNVRIFSTNFPRTIQSVRGTLVGLFPDGFAENDDIIEIDCRHTDWMIPDPQPRRSKEQEELERELASRPYILERDNEMLSLAARCTRALKDVLGEGAFDMAYGVGDDNDADAENGSDGSKKEAVLPWGQLAEITTCLKVRDMLPETISVEDQEALTNHGAWRWFESLRHPRLIYLAMNKFAQTIVETMQAYDKPNEPPLTIYSAHDSTLIGLLCSFRLEQPSVWPEYGSYLKIELLEVVTSPNDDDKVEEKELVVRFYLNGELLRTQWHGTTRDEIGLEHLAHLVATEGVVESTT